MSLTVGELAATITVDDTEAEQGLNGFQGRLRSALARATQQAREGGQDAGGALGEGLDEGASDGADAAGASITGKLKGLALGAIGGSLGAALMAGMAQALEQEQISAKLGATLGATPAEAHRYGQIAGQLYADAITEDFQGAADAIKATMGSGLLPPDATNSQIQSISTKVSDLANTFDQDLGGVTNAVGQLMRTGLASNAQEAFDILTAGFQSSANKADDLLDTVNEYSTQWRRVGLDGQTALGLIDQGVKNGARDSDQVADAIGQFGELALAGGSSVETAFKSIGLNADTMSAKIGKGGTSARDALQQTLDALRGTTNEQTKLNAATTLFGDPGTVMGDALFALDPATAAASSGMDKAAGATDRLGNSLRDNAATQFEQFKRRATEAFVQVLGDKVVPVLTQFGDWLQTHSGVAKLLAVGVTALGAAFAIAAVAVWAMNSALLANPMFWIVAAVVVAVAGLVYLIVTYWDQIKAATIAAWDWVVQKLIWAKDAIIFVFLHFTLPGLLINYWSSIQSGAVSAWNAIVSWVTGIPGRLYNAFLNWTLLGLIIKHWSGIKTATMTKAAEMINYVRSIPGRISAAFSGMGTLLVGKGRDLIRGLYNGVRGMGGWLRSQLISFAKDMIPGPIADALGIHSPSRVLADQVGHWIPAGIAQGAEDNAGVIDKTMRNLVTVPTAGQATAAGIAARGGGAVSGAGTSGDVVRIGSDGTAFGDLVISTLRQAVGTRGGNVQFAITGRSA
ncbi:phage tail tape measure protein [Streptomyces sp. NPDC006333]|uniref:phage tail tape measure protein n=1 Tax=Streptomyces sp. NPDC006333 TaxID=3156753 RepID=UPI0033A8AFB5